MASISTTKSKRPSNNAFKQQRLCAWQPILTPKTAIATFFLIGILFIPIGLCLLYLSDEVKEKIIDYTYCISESSNYTCAQIVSDSPSQECKCKIDFTLVEDLKANVFLYYGLSNFYQNHRRYVKSRDDYQLLGDLGQPPSQNCEPFAYVEKNDVKIPIAPCGAIANSLFNDSFTVFSLVHNDHVPLLRTEIAWPSDKEVMFRNPPGKGLKDAFSGFARPVAWGKEVWELDSDESNNGFQNEDFIVWMRTAAFPTFRKLHRRVDHSQEGFQDGLPKGKYILHVNYLYQVSSFDGRKRLILSNTSPLGGKNPLLGIAYVIVGGACIFLGIFTIIINLRYGKIQSEFLVGNSGTSFQ